MPPRIIHVGADTCHRVGVLESAGYRVDECQSAADLRAALESDPQPDAVVVTGDHGRLYRQTVSLVRAHEQLLLILFGEPQRSFAEADFDLIVPFLAPPEAWLPDVAGLIMRNQTLSIRSRMARRNTAALQKQTTESSAETREEARTKFGLSRKQVPLQEA